MRFLNTSFQPILSALAVVLFAGCQSASKPVPLPGSEAPAPAAGAPAAAAPTAGGWVATASGLRYKVVRSGAAEGRSPTRLDSVTVHYRGTLTDGTVFDSSIERGAPATFGVGQVIAGWTEALQLMKPGDEWLLHIPAHLAYGSRAVGKIPPNSDLIFQVALLQVQ